jgi:enoyl-CoA hydratase/carnithine racemase
MNVLPFRREVRRGILYLTLDTPGAEVNVLTREAAGFLHDTVENGISAEIRALVLRSSKPRSFVNGVGLLLAGTMKTAEDAAALTRPVREAYTALRECKVPTIAAIEGNCYGCGVELVLQCRYRVAADTFDTHFRMTELPDYLFLPTFGGTQDLPRLLGLDTAADFVLWGDRLSASQAREAGLVDDLFARANFDQEIERFIDEREREEPGRRPRMGEGVPASDESTHRRQHERIQRLPPTYRAVYSTGLTLLEEAASRPSSPEGYRRESQESAESLLAAPCRAAWPFFFTRQMARALAIGRATKGARAPAFDTRDRSLDSFKGELAFRTGPVPGAGDQGAGNIEPLRLVRYERQGGPSTRPGDVAVADALDAEPAAGGGARVVLYAPLRHLGVEVIEVAAVAEEDAATQQAVSAVLAGPAAFTVLRSRPTRMFVLDELLAAWLAPQAAYLEANGSPADLACSLRSFGFTRFAGDWLGRLNVTALRRLIRNRRPDLSLASRSLLALPEARTPDGRYDALPIDALMVSLGGFAARMLGTRALQHPTMVDVAMRDVIDFPLQHTSLCRHFSISRASVWLQDQSAFRHLVADDDLSALKEFVANGREYYLGPRHE